MFKKFKERKAKTQEEREIQKIDRSLDNYQRNRPTIMNEMAREEEDYNMDKFSSKKIIINNTCKFRTKVSRFN